MIDDYQANKNSIAYNSIRRFQYKMKKYTTCRSAPGLREKKISR